MLSLWFKIKEWAAGVGVALGLATALYLKGKSDGKSESESKQTKQTLKNMQVAANAKAKVDSKSDEEIRSSKWVRVLPFIFLLSSCACPLPTSDFCLIYQPIYLSKDDSLPTMRSVVKHNEVWESICQ
jgi:hypothetical protein